MPDSKELEELIKQQLTHFKNELTLIEQAEARKASVKEEIKRYEQMLAIYAGTNNKSAAKTTRPKRRKTRKSNNSVTLITEHFVSHPTEAFSVDELASVVGISSTSTSAVLRHLAQVGVIRLSHKGGTTGRRNYYRIST